MLDALVTGKRSLGAVAVAAVIAVAWQAWPPPALPARAHRAQVPRETPPAYSYVPLTGDPVTYAEEDGQCVPFVRPLTAHPNWRLRFTRGVSGCLGDFLDDSFSVAADGTMIWSRPDMPTRELGLSDEELGLVRSLDTLSCEDTDKDRHGYYVGWYRIAISDDVHALGGATIPETSEMARRLDAMFDGALARYRSRVLSLGTARGWLVGEYEGRRFKVEIDGHQVRVSRHGRVLDEETLEDEELVDLIDVARFGAPKPDRYFEVVAHGEMHFAGFRFPVEILRAERGPYGVISRAIANAAYSEQHPDR